MANNFGTLKNNQSKDKFILLRVKPSRFLNDLLTDIGGGKYEYTFDQPIQSLLENGSALTKVQTSPSIGEYSYNELTNTLTVYPALAPSSSNAIVIDYLLFYTTNRNRVATEDPEDAGSTLRNWEPRVLSGANTTVGTKDILDGVLSFNSTTVTLANEDANINNFLTKNDSFRRKPVDIWLCIDSTENIKHIYSGKVTDIDLQNFKATISFDDPLAGLKEPALMGDSSSDSYWTIEDFPTMDQQFNATPIPYIIGSVSRYQLGLEPNSGLRIIPETLYDAVNTDFSEDIGTSVNREWGCCRLSPDGVLDFSFTSISVDNTDPNFTLIEGTSAEIDKFRVGDTFEVVYSATSYYARVLDVDKLNDEIKITKTGALAQPSTVNANNCPTVIVTNGSDETYYLKYLDSYTATVSALASGNKYLKITLNNNFEAGVGITDFDPGVYSVKFRVRPDTTSARHGTVLKRIIDDAGLSTAAASFTAANSALANDVNFSIPNFDESDFSDYSKYCQDILKSTFSYLYIDDNLDLNYSLFNTPASASVVDNIDILKDSFDIDIDYNDIVSKIIAFNPHYSSLEAVSDASNTPSLTLESIKAKHLHGIDKTIRFRHVLERIDNRLQDILDVRSSRIALYSFDTDSINLDNVVGNDITIERSDLLDGTSSNLTILEINKGIKKARLTLTDLLEI